MTEQAVILRGHQPATFKGQKGRLLTLFLQKRPQRVPAYELSRIALQYCARIAELRDAGYVIESEQERVDGQVHGYFRLVSCPGEAPAEPLFAAGSEREEVKP
jgi:hypothetical protein